MVFLFYRLYPVDKSRINEFGQTFEKKDKKDKQEKETKKKK